MNRWGTGRSLLGLAIDEQAISVAEVQGNGAGPRVMRHARFEIPPSLSWDKPEPLGDALRTFLVSSGITARRAVAGLPGRWLLTRAHATPPTDERTALRLLRLAIERHVASDAGDWVFDAAGSMDGKAARSILLAATPRRRLDAVMAVARAAGLEVEAMTATALTLAVSIASSQGLPAPGAVLILGKAGGELALLRGGEVLALERVSVHAASSSAMAVEVRRAQAAAATAGVSSPAAMAVWNEAGIAEVTINRLGEELSLPVQVVRPGEGQSKDSMAAASLAVAALRCERLSVDFLDSRLAEAPPRRVTLRRVVTATAVIALLAAAVYLIVDWYSQQWAVDRLKAELTAMKEQTVTARANVSRLHLVRGWYEDRPPMLECLRALTMAFPDSGKVWATSLTLRDDMTGTLAGRASEEPAVFELIDRIKGSKAGGFTSVKVQQVRQDNRGVSFAVTFVFAATE